jgi:hypothetical protein
MMTVKIAGVRAQIVLVQISMHVVVVDILRLSRLQLVVLIWRVTLLCVNQVLLLLHLMLLLPRHHVVIVGRRRGLVGGLENFINFSLQSARVGVADHGGPVHHDATTRRSGRPSLHYCVIFMLFLLLLLCVWFDSRMESFLLSRMSVCVCVCGFFSHSIGVLLQRAHIHHITFFLFIINTNNNNNNSKHLLLYYIIPIEYAFA